MKKVTIPKDIMAELAALPAMANGTQPYQYTPEQDAILLQMWAITQKAAFCKWWRGKYGCGSENTLRKRVNYLKEQDAL